MTFGCRFCWCGSSSYFGFVSPPNKVFRHKEFEQQPCRCARCSSPNFSMPLPSFPLLSEFSTRALSINHCLKIFKPLDPPCHHHHHHHHQPLSNELTHNTPTHPQSIHHKSTLKPHSTQSRLTHHGLDPVSSCHPLHI